jgi:hypothetical protein
MLLKKIAYNEYLLVLNSTGDIYVTNNKSVLLPFVNVADVPIVNELTNELLKYYVEWLKCPSQS